VAEHAARSAGSRTGRGYVLRSFLAGFRRAPAVPAAAGGELPAELAPLFAALDEIEAEARESRRLAALKDQAEAADAAEEIELILSDAQGQAASEHDDALKAAHRAADVEIREILEAGVAAAEQIRTVGLERCEPLAAEVADRVLAFPGEPS
jgi:hypothetical protein